MLHQRPVGILKFLSRFFDGIISVNMKLKEWAEQNLHTSKVIFINNYASISPSETKIEIEGKEGKRIIHVAGWRLQKDHRIMLL